MQEAIKNLKINTYINAVVATQNTLPWRLPDPKVWELVKDKFPEITPQQTMLIGKDSGDLSFAAQVGIVRRVWKRNNGGDPQRCEGFATHTAYCDKSYNKKRERICPRDKQ